MRRANFETSSNLALRPSSAWTRPTRLGRIAGGIRRGISGFLKRPRIRNIVAKVGTTAGKAYGWTKRKVTGISTGRKFMRYRGLSDRVEFARRRRRLTRLNDPDYVWRFSSGSHARTEFARRRRSRCR